MKGDFHVRICERLKLKYFGLLDPFFNARSSQILIVSRNATATPQKLTFLEILRQKFVNLN